MRKNKGFTLVELLAVIVILAIIMIIAIPAVLNTMQSARRKTLLEYAQKVYITGERKYLEDISFGNIPSINKVAYIYSIRDDLELSSTGDFDGFFVVENNNNEIKYQILVYDKELVIQKENANSEEITDSDIKTKKELLDLYDLDDTYPQLTDIGQITKDFLISYFKEGNERLGCSDTGAWYYGYSLVDVAKPNEYVTICK